MSFDQPDVTTPASPAPSARPASAPTAASSPPFGSASPPPPPPSSSPSSPATAPIRAGDLTTRWRILVGAAWVAAFFAYAAVWQASVQIGIGTWWIGPRAAPSNIALRLLPFVMCLAVALWIVYGAPHAFWVSALGVGLAAIGAIPDLSRSTGLGLAEFVIAGLLGLVTLNALNGRFRLVPAGSVAAHPPAPLLDVTGPPSSTPAPSPTPVQSSTPAPSSSPSSPSSPAPSAPASAPGSPLPPPRS